VELAGLEPATSWVRSNFVLKSVFVSLRLPSRLRLFARISRKIASDIRYCSLNFAILLCHRCVTARCLI